jgi:hypothetical protein
MYYVSFRRPPVSGEHSADIKNGLSACPEKALKMALEKLQSIKW